MGYESMFCFTSDLEEFIYLLSQTFFDGKCFMLDGTEVQIVDSEKEAIMIACIEEVLFNELSYN